MTILTTGSNLEDLLESKPTARGQVLSRFMGLEFLKRKEEVAKELYSEFSKSKISPSLRSLHLSIVSKFASTPAKLSLNGFKYFIDYILK